MHDNKCYNILMLLVAFVQWWYSAGWRDCASRIKTRLQNTYLTFSVPILFTTMFSPWKRIISYPGSSLQDRMRAVLDNLISRVIGFSVRLMALIAATVIMVVSAVLGVALLIIWPFLPIIGPIFTVVGIL
jgi:hypothetical protein